MKLLMRLVRTKEYGEGYEIAGGLSVILSTPLICTILPLLLFVSFPVASIHFSGGQVLDTSR